MSDSELDDHSDDESRHLDGGALVQFMDDRGELDEEYRNSLETARESAARGRGACGLLRRLSVLLLANVGFTGDARTTYHVTRAIQLLLRESTADVMEPEALKKITAFLNSLGCTEALVKELGLRRTYLSPSSGLWLLPNSDYFNWLRGVRVQRFGGREAKEVSQTEPLEQTVKYLLRSHSNPREAFGCLKAILGACYYRQELKVLAETLWRVFECRELAEGRRLSESFQEALENARGQARTGVRLQREIAPRGGISTSKAISLVRKYRGAQNMHRVLRARSTKWRKALIREHIALYAWKLHALIVHVLALLCSRYFHAAPLCVECACALELHTNHDVIFLARVLSALLSMDVPWNLLLAPRIDSRIDEAENVRLFCLEATSMRGRTNAPTGGSLQAYVHGLFAGYGAQAVETGRFYSSPTTATELRAHYSFEPAWRPETSDDSLKTFFDALGLAPDDPRLLKFRSFLKAPQDDKAKRQVGSYLLTLANVETYEQLAEKVAGIAGDFGRGVLRTEPPKPEYISQALWLRKTFDAKSLPLSHSANGDERVIRILLDLTSVLGVQYGVLEASRFWVQYTREQPRLLDGLSGEQKSACIALRKDRLAERALRILDVLRFHDAPASNEASFFKRAKRQRAKQEMLFDASRYIGQGRFLGKKRRSRHAASVGLSLSAPFASPSA